MKYQASICSQIIYFGKWQRAHRKARGRGFGRARRALARAAAAVAATIYLRTRGKSCPVPSSTTRSATLCAPTPPPPCTGVEEFLFAGVQPWADARRGRVEAPLTDPVEADLRHWSVRGRLCSSIGGASRGETAAVEFWPKPGPEWPTNRPAALVGPWLGSWLGQPGPNQARSCPVAQPGPTTAQLGPRTTLSLQSPPPTTTRMRPHKS